MVIILDVIRNVITHVLQHLVTIPVTIFVHQSGLTITLDSVKLNTEMLNIDI